MHTGDGAPSPAMRYARPALRHASDTSSVARPHACPFASTRMHMLPRRRPTQAGHHAYRDMRGCNHHTGPPILFSLAVA